MQKHSLRKIVSFLNNSEEDGGFWLPNIQRPFIWSKDQICRLYDSIMREYPISTLLMWKTKSTVRHRKFIENYHNGLRVSDFYVPENDKKKCLVLDGQQRLQSLFIGLRGSYEGQELFLNILSGEVAAPDDVKFKFEFRNANEAIFPWIKFKDLVFSPDDLLNVAEGLTKGLELTDEERHKISRHVSIVFKSFHSNDGISYQELDSIVYFRYHFAKSWGKAKRIETYLLRTLISGAFSGTPDQLIDDCVEKIKEQKDFNVEHIFDVIRTKGRSLELTEDRLWQMGYGSDSIHLLFNLWYSFNYTPAYDNNLPQVDHIFPQSALRKVMTVNPFTNRKIMKYTKIDRDQLANCMLLTKSENGAGGKSDTLPEVWFADKDESYLDLHLIPRDKDLWKIDQFEKFIEERKKLISAKLSYLLPQRKASKQKVTIMATEIIDSDKYAELVGHDVALLITKKMINIISITAQKNKGNIIKTMGESTLSFFKAGVKDALEAAFAIQGMIKEYHETMSNSDDILHVRIGLHTDLAFIDANDISGDMLFIAIRYMQLADPGGVCISKEVFNELDEDDKIKYGWKVSEATVKHGLRLQIYKSSEC